MDLFSLHGELSAQQVRTTRETPRRVSVFDVIKAVTGAKNPRTGLGGLVQTVLVKVSDPWMSRTTPFPDADKIQLL